MRVDWQAFGAVEDECTALCEASRRCHLKTSASTGTLFVVFWSWRLVLLDQFIFSDGETHADS
jgi:hypothetical protein